MMLENLDIVQVILIGLGLVIVASVFLKSDEKKPDPVVPPPVVPPPVAPPTVEPLPVEPVDNGHDFMCLVQKWHDLKACAHEQGLHEVCKVLDTDVFPLLNQPEKHEVKS
jgi:hypothetical protein